MLKTKNQQISLLTVILLVTQYATPVFGADLPFVHKELKSTPYFYLKSAPALDGLNLVQAVIHGPPEPPPGYELQRVSVTLPQAGQVSGINTLAEVPAFSWSFGCTATSAAMIAGYYDRKGWGNIYTGPTNNGIIPLDNSSWPDWIDSNGDTRHQCPLSATHQGLDGREEKGHVDDYWKYYNQPGPDPWDGNWEEHAHGDCTADYLNTNQWVNPSGGWNIDGGTTFYYDPESPDLLPCDILEDAGEPFFFAGDVGFKHFFQSRGYTVSTCYSQQTDNVISGGFSFTDFKTEIDAGRPVMLHVTGHTMVGVGYDDSSNTIYFHDTWDYNVHTMVWGTDYLSMEQWLVTVIHIDPIPGDVDGNGSISLADLIITLQVASGQIPEMSINLGADVDGDGVIGLAEAFYIINYLD